MTIALTFSVSKEQFTSPASLWNVRGRLVKPSSEAHLAS